MASGKAEYGIIILGNAGSGKSFLCNLIIGSERFEADFQPEAVTTKTDCHRLTTPTCDFLVYNIPGLVEVNQAQIDRNKREIQKAFEQCSKAVVLFVWTQIGGRAQDNDVIAFKALNDAYAFPREALVFVVNNVPVNRPAKYDGLFIATLSNALKPIPVSDIDTIFIDTFDMGDQKQKYNARTKLMARIAAHPALKQQQQHPIKLQSDELNEMRNRIKKQQEEAERDRAKFQAQIDKMTQEYTSKQAEANEKYETMVREATKSQNEYVNPFKALLRFADSAADFAVGTTQMAGLGAFALFDKVTGSTDEEITERLQRLVKGTAAERVYGP